MKLRLSIMLTVFSRRSDSRPARGRATTRAIAGNRGGIERLDFSGLGRFHCRVDQRNGHHAIV